jgi:hypothetical protein
MPSKINSRQYRRAAVRTILDRLKEPRRFIQILAGPRQSGKTTIARQAMQGSNISSHYATADEPSIKDRLWLEQQWNTGRLLEKENGTALLVLDEIQKIPGWSEIVKWLWDEDSGRSSNLYVLLLGSSPLLLQKGMTESLAGRFELIPISHWSYLEMKGAFGIDLNQYIYFGGYPGAVPLVPDEQRWRHYILDALIETAISRDILLMTRIDKPILLRRMFELGCLYSGQIMSFQKMVGQLQDAGNTTTLAHYLDLLGGAGILTGLQKYSGKELKKRSSSPKLLVNNTAIMSALSHHTFKDALEDHEFWGRIVESAIGAHLLNGILGSDLGLYYWSGLNREVDYVLVSGEEIIAIEVKSSLKKTNLPGMEMFSRHYKIKKPLLVGAQGIPLEKFLSISPAELFL